MVSSVSTALAGYQPRETIINGVNSGESNEIPFDFANLATGVYDIYVYVNNNTTLKNYVRYIKWLSTIDLVNKETLVINCGESLSVRSDSLYTGSYYSIIYMYKVN